MVRFTLTYSRWSRFNFLLLEVTIDYDPPPPDSSIMINHLQTLALKFGFNCMATGFVWHPTVVDMEIQSIGAGALSAYRTLRAGHMLI